MPATSWINCTVCAPRYLGLQLGDVAFHQSDLLHGVRIGDQQHRWSWILWFKDDPKCPELGGYNWNLQKAQEGQPVAQFLQAHRAHHGHQQPTAAARNKVFLPCVCTHTVLPCLSPHKVLPFLSTQCCPLSTRCCSLAIEVFWLSQQWCAGDVDAQGCRRGFCKGHE